MKCLIDFNFKAPDEERDRLHQYISDLIGIITWNIAARITITKKNENLLLDAINKEINRWSTFLFNLLSVTYDSGSIKRIKENLESGTVESVNYALEMIDIVIEDSIKPKLIPLLDVIPDEERVKSLYQFFPGEVTSYQKLIEDIVNRDYNLLGIWIRACAIRNTSRIEHPGLTESLIALLFSPEEILREEAAMLISRSDKAVYESVSNRLPVQVRSSLRKIIDGGTFPDELIYKKVRFLSTVFAEMPEENILYLAGKLQYSNGVDSSVLTSPGRYIVWSNDPGKGWNNPEVVYESKAKQKKVTRKESGVFRYVLPLNQVEQFLRQFPEHTAEIMKYIEINES